MQSPQSETQNSTMSTQTATFTDAAPQPKKAPAGRITLAYLAAIAVFVLCFFLSYEGTFKVLQLIRRANPMISNTGNLGIFIFTTLAGISCNIASCATFILICPPPYAPDPARTFCIILIILGIFSGTLLLITNVFPPLPLPLFTVLIHFLCLHKIKTLYLAS